MSTDFTERPTKTKVSKAGKILRQEGHSSEEIEEALDVLSRWRALYYRPLNTFQALIRTQIKSKGYKSVIVAQRLKRMPSIIAKLKRFPAMQLDTMQDIGGVRAVLNSVNEVLAIHKGLVEGRHKHEAVFPPKNYIKEPKADGYRGIHQVFKYRTDQHKELEGMLIEVQIRTKLQHYWATAVETLGAIERSSFKTGQGDEKYKQFFRLASALFSIEEKQPIIASLQNKTPNEIVSEFRKLEAELGVFNKLSTFTSAVKAIDGVTNKKNDGFNLLILDAAKKTMSFIPFSKGQSDLADQMYMLLEQKARNTEGLDVVLAAAGDLKDLRKAYPNYFIDTKSFINNLNSICTKIESPD